MGKAPARGTPKRPHGTQPMTVRRSIADTPSRRVEVRQYYALTVVYLSPGWPLMDRSETDAFADSRHCGNVCIRDERPAEIDPFAACRALERQTFADFSP